MKKYFLFIFLFQTGIIFAQYNYYKIDTLNFKKFDQLQNKSFYESTNSKQLLYYIKSSKKKFKLVFTFTYSCKPCREKASKNFGIAKKV